MLNRAIRRRIKNKKFDQLYKVEKDPRVKERFLAMAHIGGGASVIEAAEVVKRTRQAVNGWVVRFEEEGISGLYDKEGRGGKPFLKPERHEDLINEIENLQEERGGHVTAGDIRNLIEEKFDVVYREKSVYDVLEKLRMSWVSGRSIHPKADLVAQKVFKKNSKN